MSDERELVQRIRQELDARVEAQSPTLQGRLRAARREALQGRLPRTGHRLWLPAVAASLFAVVATTSLWLQQAERSGNGVEVLLQAANEADLQLLRAGDDIELYQELEFYYWMQQERAHAG